LVIISLTSIDIETVEISIPKFHGSRNPVTLNIWLPF